MPLSGRMTRVLRAHHPLRPRRPPGALANEEEDEDGADEDDEDDVVVKPRGRLAARMIAQPTKPAPSVPTTEKEDDDVVARVRRLFQLDKQPPTSVQENEDVPDSTLRPVTATSATHPTAAATSTPRSSRDTHTRTAKPWWGLFVSPEPRHTSNEDNDDNDDDDLPPLKSDRFAALVGESAMNVWPARKRSASAPRSLPCIPKRLGMAKTTRTRTTAVFTDDEGGRRLIRSKLGLASSVPPARRLSSR